MRFKQVKDWIRLVTPPLLWNLMVQFKAVVFKSGLEVWSGDYRDWSQASAMCTGYASTTILDKCKDSLLQVKNGQAKYERDGILFEEIQHSWGLLTGLQKAALEHNGQLRVMDFGGSLGTSYFQNRDLLNSVKDLNWAIVEQSHFVDCGKKYFESNQLKFYHSVEECVDQIKPNLLLLSGVLQCLENPGAWIQKFISLKIPYIILDRTPFIQLERDLLTVQNVPEAIYKASYPSWFFSDDQFLLNFKGYSLLGSFDSYCDPPIVLNSKVQAAWRGHILKLDSQTES